MRVTLPSLPTPRGCFARVGRWSASKASYYTSLSPATHLPSGTTAVGTSYLASTRQPNGSLRAGADRDRVAGAARADVELEEAVAVAGCLGVGVRIRVPCVHARHVPQRPEVDCTHDLSPTPT